MTTLQEALKKIKAEIRMYDEESYESVKWEECYEALKQTNVLDKIKDEIEQVKSIMNEEIIDHNRKDLINFVNGLNQSLVIIDKYRAESEDKE